MKLDLDPKGLWRRQRFEFCNALEVVIEERGDVLEKRAWAELERLGVRRSKEGERK